MLVMMMVVVLVLFVMMLIPPVIVILVVVVMMVVIVNELYIRIFCTALSTGSSFGRVCNPQKRGGIWNGIKQFSK
jgi:type IV secretory pathway VirB3-like protein